MYCKILESDPKEKREEKKKSLPLLLVVVRIILMGGWTKKNTQKVLIFIFSPFLWKKCVFGHSIRRIIRDFLHFRFFFIHISFFCFPFFVFLLLRFFSGFCLSFWVYLLIRMHVCLKKEKLFLYIILNKSPFLFLKQMIKVVTILYYLNVGL